MEHIFVHGDSLQAYLVAVIVPNPEQVQRWATAHGVPASTPIATIITLPQFKADMMADMEVSATNAKVCAFAVACPVRCSVVDGARQWSLVNAAVTCARCS